MPSFEVTTRTDGDVATLVIEGEVDLATAPSVDAAVLELERSSPATLVIDLGGVGFIDSTGLRTLLTARRRAEEDGRSLRLANVPSEVQRVLEITGAGPMFDIDPAGPPSS